MTTLIPGLVMLEQVPQGTCSRVGYRPQGTSVLLNKCLNMTLHLTFNNTLHAFCKRRGNSNYRRTILQHHWTAATLTTLAIDQTTICWSSRSLKKRLKSVVQQQWTSAKWLAVEVLLAVVSRSFGKEKVTHLSEHMAAAGKTGKRKKASTT